MPVILKLLMYLTIQKCYSIVQWLNLFNMMFLGNLFNWMLKVSEALRRCIKFYCKVNVILIIELSTSGWMKCDLEGSPQTHRFFCLAFGIIKWLTWTILFLRFKYLCLKYLKSTIYTYYDLSSILCPIFCFKRNL